MFCAKIVVIEFALKEVHYHGMSCPEKSAPSLNAIKRNLYGITLNCWIVILNVLMVWWTNFLTEYLLVLTFADDGWWIWGVLACPVSMLMMGISGD